MYRMVRTGTSRAAGRCAGSGNVARAEALRRRVRSSVDSGETIRADRDRDGPGVTDHVVDASVVVKWLVTEEFSDEAARLLNGGSTLVAPELVFAEAANAL